MLGSTGRCIAKRHGLLFEVQIKRVQTASRGNLANACGAAAQPGGRVEESTISSSSSSKAASEEA